MTKCYNQTKVYKLANNAGQEQYRVYGSIDEQEPQWYAVDENGVMQGVIEELDGNWDFSKFDRVSPANTRQKFSCRKIMCWQKT